MSKHAERCPVCNGKGTTVAEKICHGCNGKGWVEVGNSVRTWIPYPDRIPPSYYPPPIHYTWCIYG